MFEDDEFCTVTINGNYGGTYYVGYQNVQYLEDGTLYNTGTSTITLYASKDSSGYPRISIPSLSRPRYYASSNINYVTITDISSTNFNMASQLARFNTRYSSAVISILLILLCVVSIFRGKR